jgi:hypothetical protein
MTGPGDIATGGVLAASAALPGPSAVCLLTQALDGFGHAGAVSGIARGAVVDMGRLHFQRSAADGARRILEQDRLLAGHINWNNARGWLE